MTIRLSNISCALSIGYMKTTPLSREKRGGGNGGPIGRRRRRRSEAQNRRIVAESH